MMLALTALLAVSTSAYAHQRESRPNIVFVMADDLGYADIGYHGGGGQIKTPNLDRLAMEGVRLENYYVQPLCTPSRSVLMSGRYQIRTGLQHMVIYPAQPNGLPLNSPALPEKMREAGYATHMVGKWHVGFSSANYTPIGRGFDSFLGYYNYGEGYYTHQICDADLDCGMDMNDNVRPDYSFNNSYSAHFFTQRASNLIKEQASNDKPMFLYMAYQNVHAPLEVPARYEEQYSHIKNENRRKLAAMASVLDEGVGNLTIALKEAGIWNNTILIFSTDNGGLTQALGGVGCNYPLRGSKLSFFEGGIRANGFVTGPLVKNKGTVNKELMHIADWYPTLVKLAGGSVQGVDLDGFDQWSTINSGTKSPRKEFIINIDPIWPLWGFQHDNTTFDNRQLAGIRMGDMKLLTGMPLLSGWYKPVKLEGEENLSGWKEINGVFQNSRGEEITSGLYKVESPGGWFDNLFLFNITADPYEYNNLVKQEPAIVKAMLDRLAELEKTAVPVRFPPRDEAANPALHGGAWVPWQNSLGCFYQKSIQLRLFDCWYLRCTYVNNNQLGSRMDLTTNTLHWADYVILVVYFIFVLAVGLWTSRGNRGSVKGYFLAGQSQHWIPVGASIFASNIGSNHFIGLAGGGAATGYSVAYYELHAVAIVLILGWVFVPVYIAAGVKTMPEYLKLRFGGQRIRMFLSIMSLIAYIFVKISTDIFAGSIFIEQALKLNTIGSVAGVVIVAAVFTMTGGLTAVIWTDFVQTILMVVGAITLAILSFVEVGGYNSLIDRYQASISTELILSNRTCGMTRSDSMHIFRDPITGDLPWPGAITGALIKSLWYWCTDQVIVQRALAAKDITHAKLGTVLAGVLKMLPLFLLVMPGMIARVLYPDIVGCSSKEVCMKVCGSSSGCSNLAYSTLVLQLMPAGARGLMLAVMLAALVSSLTSVFNSSSTIFTLDIWTKIRKQASSTELLVVGRLFILVQIALSVAWVPILKGTAGDQLFIYIVEIGSFFQSPIVAVFLLALFTDRVNEKGAFWAVLIGCGAGMIRLIIQYSYDKPTCDNPVDHCPSIIKDFHFLYFAVFTFLLTLAIAIVISLLSKPMDKKQLTRLTFWDRFNTKPRVDTQEVNEQEQTDMNSNIQMNEASSKEDDGSKLSDKDNQSSCYNKTVFVVCGIDLEAKHDQRVTAQEKAAIIHHADLHEKTIPRLIANTAAILVATLSVFVLGFYA